jgi:hypothetical protein
MEITGLWDVIMCNLVDKCQHFEGTFCHHVQVRMKNPEEESSVFLQSVGSYLPECTASHLRRQQPLC